MDKKLDSHFDLEINKLLLKSKRSQSQIITTVLIILLVLAAIVIVWQVVNNTVQSSTREVEERSECIGINLNIEKISGTDVTVRRGAGGPSGPVNVAVLVEGFPKEASIGDADPLETHIYTHSVIIPSGKGVVIAAEINGKLLCPAADSAIAP
ncbi:hypothetical protein J4221_03825 [Candidatus Pacearchaeota archaeon]|nr:hypothetical protein [Candidatus Pacearchaeota archaeon]